MRLVLAVVSLVVVAGCSGPFMWLPGGRLGGPEAALDMGAVPAGGGVMQLETRPADPYSVNIGYQVLDGQIYIDPAPERAWYQHIQANPNVRVRFDGSEVIYTALAQPVADAEVLSRFDAERIVLRLTPRPVGS